MRLWLKSITSLFRTPRSNRSLQRSRPLRCESLEERLNPSTSFAQEFVTQVYTDLLHRSVDPRGLASSIQMIDQGTPLYEVVLDIESSQEYRDDQVEQIYESYLNRPADSGGTVGWSSALLSNPVEQVQADIIGSSEFYQDAGGTHQGFLNLLYKDVLNRAVDPAGEVGWIGALNAGASTMSVAQHVLSSPEYYTDLVGGYYEEFLHGSASSSALLNWVGALEHGATNQDIIADILSSPEFQADVQKGMFDAPAAPVITSPTATQPPGAPSDSHGHMVVTTTTYDITGTAPKGSLVRIYNGSDEVVGSKELGNSTSFSITVQLTKSALNRFWATATNAEGIESAATEVPGIRQAKADAIVTSPGNQKDYAGTTINLPAKVTSYVTDTPDFTATGLPKDLSINPTTGAITGTLSTADANGSPYTVTVTYDGFTSGSATFTLLVSVQNNLTVTAPATQNSVVGGNVTGVQVKVTETDTDTNPLTYSASDLPAGLTIDPTTGEISGTIASGDNTKSPYTVTVSATDGLATGSAHFTWNVTKAT
jgi:hypothetical protein